MKLKNLGSSFTNKENVLSLGNSQGLKIFFYPAMQDAIATSIGGKIQEDARPMIKRNAMTNQPEIGLCIKKHPMD